MQQNIEHYLEYLFSLALQKCENFSDAEDLTQDVLLAAYTYLDKGGKIDNIKSWLYGTLNHKYYDMLRKRYQLPIVNIDLLPEQPVYEDEPTDQPTTEQVRKEIAYLSKQYREVIVRHYLLGEKVRKIAEELNIPKGTVLSRLSTGREQIRKGMEHMEQYEKQSHTPEKLDISCYGRPGLNDEPWSLVVNDMMKQNILILAYAKPVTTVEIARALGIPTPYIEKAVEDLIQAELMCQTGNKVYTDFMITQPQDLLKNLDNEIEFAENHYPYIWSILSAAISELNNLNWVNILDTRPRTILEYYYILHILSAGTYAATTQLIPAEETYPLRPNGGKWIAVGNHYPQNFDFDSYKVKDYCYGGERLTYFEKFLGTNSIELHVYDTQPDLNKYEHGPIEIHDDNLCKLLYIMHKDIPFDMTGFNLMFLEDIPHLASCGILKIENAKPTVAIPVISKTEYQEMKRLQNQYIQRFADWLEQPLRKILPNCKIELPKHLKNRVAEFRQYSFYAIPMAVIKKAIRTGNFLQNINYPTPPMVLVIEDEINRIDQAIYDSEQEILNGSETVDANVIFAELEKKHL